MVCKKVGEAPAAPALPALGVPPLPPLPLLSEPPLAGEVWASVAGALSVPPDAAAGAAANAGSAAAVVKLLGAATALLGDETAEGMLRASPVGVTELSASVTRSGAIWLTSPAASAP